MRPKGTTVSKKESHVRKKNRKEPSRGRGPRQQGGLQERQGVNAVISQKKRDTDSA